MREGPDLKCTLNNTMVVFRVHFGLKKSDSPMKEGNVLVEKANGDIFANE